MSRFRKRGPQLTGPDYLMGMARGAADNGQPYAEEFSMMLFSAFAGQNHLLIEIEASRPLREHEASPMAIILSAYKAAAAQGDKESVEEVLRVGLTLLAKWPSWLALTTAGHPELQLKEAEDT